MTDLEIVYLGGITDSITYGEGDEVYDGDDSIVVLVKHPTTRVSQERLTCFKRNMLSYRYRDRQMRIEDLSAPPVVNDAPGDIGSDHP